MRISLLLAAVVATAILGTEAANAQQTVPRTGNTAPRTTAPRTTAPATSTVAKQGTSVAVIDVGYIFKNAQRFKTTMDGIKKDGEKFQEQITRERDAINAQIQKLQGMQRTDPQYKLLEEQIAGDQTQLRLKVARAQKDRVEREAKVYHNAYVELERQIRAFAGRYGVDLVLRFNREQMDPSKPESVLNGINRFVVFQNQIDITGHILDAMNRSGGGTPQPQPRIGGTGTRPGGVRRQ